jgi:hypothetical protein
MDIEEAICELGDAKDHISNAMEELGNPGVLMVGDSDVRNKIGSMMCTIDEAIAELEELKKNNGTQDKRADN